MDERFLHYVWKFQKFSCKALKTTVEQPLIVLSPGYHNHHSGPDFEEARVKIGDMEWAGSVEIHIKSSDWNRHQHQHDRAYDNVILHVVWEDDQPLEISGEFVATLELQSIIEDNLLPKYDTFINQHEDILCASQLSTISDISFVGALDRMMIERLEQKSQQVHQSLAENNHDWEATTYAMLATNFGFSTNKEAFVALSRCLPFKVLKKYQGNSKSVEALIFGQAGFLSDPTDSYQKELEKEHGYLQKKHQLPSPLPKSRWKFGRMRPENFPTVRLAQFSSLMAQNTHFFSKLIETSDPKKLLGLLEVAVSPYWEKHYDFGKVRKRSSTQLGKATRENLHLNTTVSILAAYGTYLGDQTYLDRAVRILEGLSAENNTIIRKWIALGKYPSNAFDSQALIGLYKNHCSKKRCIECSIGIEVLGNS